jgi:SAM-dependent methyltransferase
MNTQVVPLNPQVTVPAKKAGSPIRPRAAAAPAAREGDRAGILARLPKEQRLFGSIVLAVELILLAALKIVPPAHTLAVVIAMLAFFALMFAGLIYLNLVHARSAQVDGLADEDKAEVIKEQQPEVAWSDHPPLTHEALGTELRGLREVLAQASRFSTPTYYLDKHLNLIDWNPAFELIFRPILHKVRFQHVNHFIVELANWKDVFRRAREFTERVKRGELPSVHMEPLVYNSSDYGVVHMEKVACQLNDTDANLKAWSVALLIEKIDWARFRADLEQRLKDDKLWSLYARSYDAVLLEFPPYKALLKEVIDAIPRGARQVLELGAGTGNATRELLQRGYQVTAVENNDCMLEKLFAKGLEFTGQLTVNKTSADHLDWAPSGSFDAVAAVNVLYALDDPAACIRQVARVLKPGAVFTFSSTHSETDLDPLLGAIKKQLKADRKFSSLEEHFRRVQKLNKSLELSSVRRYSRKDYLEWLTAAVFPVSRL